MSSQKILIWSSLLYWASDHAGWTDELTQVDWSKIGVSPVAWGYHFQRQNDHILTDGSLGFVPSFGLDLCPSYNVNEHVT